MKKNFFKAFAALVMLFCFVISTNAAVTLRYYNKDSKEHTMTVKISGSTKTVEFGSSKTSSVTIQGSATKATIETSCGDIEVSDGDDITIKDGCITIN